MLPTVVPTENLKGLEVQPEFVDLGSASSATRTRSPPTISSSRTEQPVLRGMRSVYPRDRLKKMVNPNLSIAALCQPARLSDYINRQKAAGGFLKLVTAVSTVTAHTQWLAQIGTLTCQEHLSARLRRPRLHRPIPPSRPWLNTRRPQQPDDRGE